MIASWTSEEEHKTHIMEEPDVKSEQDKEKHYGQFHCEKCKKNFASKKKLDGHNQFVHMIMMEGIPFPVTERYF